MNSQMIDTTVVVAGGTGNVGSYMVSGLLERGARVVVPSRSERKLEELRSFLRSRDAGGGDRLYTLHGDVGDEAGAEALREQIRSAAGAPDAVVSSLGRFVPAPSVLDATAKELQQVIDGYLLAHFVVARTFIPDLKESGGTYTLVNGPLAFDPWPDSAAGLVSIVTAAQQMLFRVLVEDLESSAVDVFELVNYAYIRERQTQPGSSLSGEDVGTFVAHLIAGETGASHGESIHLKSPEQLEAVGIEQAGATA